VQQSAAYLPAIVVSSFPDTIITVEKLEKRYSLRH